MKVTIRLFLWLVLQNLLSCTTPTPSPVLATPEVSKRSDEQVWPTTPEPEPTSAAPNATSTAPVSPEIEDLLNPALPPRKIAVGLSPAAKLAEPAILTPALTASNEVDDEDKPTLGPEANQVNSTTKIQTKTLPAMPSPQSEELRQTLNVQWHAYCEARGPHYISSKSQEAEKCARTCAQDASCQAFTHISGWGRCFLKKNNQGQVRIRFHSGERAADNTFTPQSYDLDFPGKDLRLVVKIKTWQDCAAACVAEPACQAYGYLEGIASCWLKNGVVPPITKVFSCGVKRQ